jgi:trehalose 6-phosphate synthase/phosphatase
MIGDGGGSGPLANSSPAVLGRVVARLRRAPHLLLLLDYDGTLVPFAPAPELAVPDAALLELLATLAARRGTGVHVVSGRTWETLDRWLGSLPIGLHAEHGLWSRLAGEAWRAAAIPEETRWRERARPILAAEAARTPGSLVEEKTASLAWHYRLVEPALGVRRAAALRRRLVPIVATAPVDLLEGEKVIELRPRGVHKGLLVGPLVAAAPSDACVVALGDDRTDEDTFAALPPGAVAVHVGPTPSRAAVRLPSVADARALLGALV